MEPHPQMTRAQVEELKAQCGGSLQYCWDANDGSSTSNDESSSSFLLTDEQCVDLARYSCCLRRGYGGAAPQESQSEVFLRKLAPWALQHYQTIPWAAYVAGICLYYGWERDVDIAQSTEAFRVGSTMRHLQCRHNYALCFLDGSGVEKDSERGIAILQELVDQEGDMDSAYCLAWSYETGNDVAQDKPRAIQIYCENVRKGHVTSMKRLGICYENGKGVEVDKAKAYELYSRAAELGLLEAFFYQARCLLFGFGVETNTEQGIALLRRGISKNDSWCRRLLAAIYTDGKAVPENKAEAVRILVDGVDHGDAKAMTMLARFYALGNGVEKDLVRARGLYQRASDLNDKDANKMLAEYCENGIGGPPDLEKAVQLYTKIGKLDKARALAMRFAQ